MAAMKQISNCFTKLFRMVFFWLAWSVASSMAAERSSQMAREKAFAGRWDLTIKDGNNNQLPSWRELKAHQGVWTATFVGRWGNARPLPTVVINGDQIHFVSPKEEEGGKTDLVFDGNLARKTLKGAAKGPDGVPWTWSGKRAPISKLRRVLNQASRFRCSMGMIWQVGDSTIPPKLPVGLWKADV